MLMMHKEDDYGSVLLKQKFKQSTKQISNFAYQFAKVLPFDLLEIEEGLTELIDEACLYIEGDTLVCNRMLKDADLSIKRSLSGSKGGQKTTEKLTDFAQANLQAKGQANTDIENINEIVSRTIDYLIKKSGKIFKKTASKNITVIKARLNEKYTEDDFKKVIDNRCDAWLNDKKMIEYLRPETLFGSKFDGYLANCSLTKMADPQAAPAPMSDEEYEEFIRPKAAING